MFRLNFKIALRNLWKNKVSSLINVLGLSIGITACLMLLIYVSYEWNFDKQAKNAANVYEVMTHITDDSGNDIMTFDGTTTAFAPLVKQGIPEIQYISRMNYGANELIANAENSFKKRSKFADPDLLKIYEYEFIHGNPATALASPNSVILTESMARILFGSADVLDKSVRYMDKTDLKVTGVIKDLPDNSSNKFDYLMPWSLYANMYDFVRDINWSNYSFVTLVSLKPDADLSAVNKKMAQLVKQNTKSTTQPHFLFPLSKLHLYGKFVNGKSVGGDIDQVWMFIGLALGILLIACVNFMNMATAKSEKRAKEVGIKKTIGATRASLIFQFLTESMVLTFLSVIIAIILVEICLPTFSNLLQIKMDISHFSSGSWLAVFGIVLFTGLVAGSYPAFYLSSFNPIQTLKRKVTSRSFFSLSLRQVLIIGQFCFAIMLIVSTLVIYKQIQYIKNRPTGVDLNALVEIPQDGQLRERFEVFKNELLKSGAVTGVFQSSIGLLHHGQNFNSLQWPGMTQAESSIMFNRIGTTYDFIKTAGMKLTSGRDFSEKHASDSAAVLVSTSAVKTMGLKNPLGTTLTMGGRKFNVVGVFEDYVWDSPYKSNYPMLIYYSKTDNGSVTMRLNPANSLQQNTENIERIMKQINPAYPIEMTFTSTLYADLLKKEKTLGILSNLFGGLAIFVSCLGLFGLVAYSAEQRTKEFGIRKVLGASVYSLMQLLSFSFLKMIMVAIVITVPLAYYVMDNWLNKFEFHTSISWWILLAASGGTMLIAFLTVSFQAYRTATANPVDALRYE